MTKRRGKIIENEVLVLPPLVKGGDDFDELYSAYQGTTDLAINPEGTYSSYTSGKSTKINKFIECNR